MSRRKLFEDCVTGVLVVCAIAITIKVVAAGSASQASIIARHVPNWESLAEGRKPVMGEPGAAVSIVEFSDYECPFCRSLEPELRAVSQIDRGKVVVIRYNFPLTSIHPHAYGAAIAAECAAAQGVYERFQARLFNGGKEFDDENWLAVAKDVSVPDLKRFSTCVTEQQQAGIISADEHVAQKLGVDATPTVIVNGDLLRGVPSVQTLETLVRQDAAGSSFGARILERLRAWL